MKDDPNWSDKMFKSDLFEMFERRDTKVVEPKPKPDPPKKEISKLQVRPLEKPSEK